MLCVLSFKIEIHTLNLWNTKLFRYFPLGIDLLLQPLLYVYVLSLTKPGFQIKGKILLHFVAPAVFLFYSIAVYFAVLPYLTIYQKDLVATDLYYNLIKTAEDIFSVISAFVYGYLCFTAIRAYQQWLNEYISDTRYPALNWLRNLFIATALLGAGLLVNVLVDYTNQQTYSFYRWQLFYLYLTFLIYYLGLKGLVFTQEAATVEITYFTEIPAKQLKYEITELAAARVLILTAMTADRIYLDNELTLHKMSVFLGLSTDLASATINTLFGKSFRAMVNDYRIAEVKLRLVDPRFHHLSMLGIALECGFNSEASFYRIFKLATGCSPKEFIKSSASSRN